MNSSVYIYVVCVYNLERTRISAFDAIGSIITTSAAGVAQSGCLEFLIWGLASVCDFSLHAADLHSCRLSMLQATIPADFNHPVSQRRSAKETFRFPR